MAHASRVETSLRDTIELVMGVVLATAIIGTVSWAITFEPEAAGAPVNAAAPIPTTAPELLPVDDPETGAPTQRPPLVPPIDEAHCVGYRFGYSLAYERLGAGGGHGPSIPTPDRANCPTRMLVPAEDADFAWCVGAMTGVGMFWSTPDVPRMIVEIARAAEESCMGNQWWQRDAAMFRLAETPHGLLLTLVPEPR